MGDWLLRLLFDWVFVLLYRLFQSFLNLVDFIESFFDIFAGTAKVFYQGNADFLINIFSFNKRIPTMLLNKLLE